PLVDAFGANLNTGWVGNSPDAKRLGFDLRIGLVGMGALIDPDEEVFRLIGILFPLQESQARLLAQNSIAGFNNLPPEQQQAIIDAMLNTPFPADVSGPTVFGPEDERVVVRTSDQVITVDGTQYTIVGQEFTIPGVGGLIQSGVFPTVVPQLTVGTVLGTHATFRYLPNITLDSQIGDLQYFGFGIQHNPLVWFENDIPVNIGLSFFTQNLKIENDVLDVSTTAFGINVSKTFGGFVASVSPYVGFLIESSNVKVDYEYEIAPGVTIPIQFDVDGVNKNRFVIGAGASLLGINLFADFNVAPVKTFQVSVMYGL
ncbi:MAG: hypothetical protein D6681_14295, partial [Calditrichaeota bacterium]